MLSFFYVFCFAESIEIFLLEVSADTQTLTHAKT